VRNAVLQVWLQDMGTGPLQLKGVAAISPLGWRLRVQARPRSKQPVMQHWLQRWGSADARGVVLVERGGGLAAMIPLPALH
jgi:hypothetical protein